MMPFAHVAVRISHIAEPAVFVPIAESHTVMRKNNPQKHNIFTFF